MIQNNNVLGAFPWYDKISEQNHRRSYAYGDVYPLTTKKDSLLPFQIMRAHSTNPITSCKMYTLNGVFEMDILQGLLDGGMVIKQFPALGYDIIVYPGLFPMANRMRDGLYYCEMSDGINTFYSEVFNVTHDTSAFLKVTWRDVEDLVFDAGQIIYKEPTYRNAVFLKTELGKPDYTFDEEGEQRDGYFFPEKQISEKTYKCTFLAPEFLCDAMRLVRLSDIIIIYDRYGREYRCDTFLITPKWETQGNLASVEMEFQTNTVVKKTGKGFSVVSGGDFNNDFNNDFNIN
jgi:hypothetical protein